MKPAAGRCKAERFQAEGRSVAEPLGGGVETWLQSGGGTYKKNSYVITKIGLLPLLLNKVRHLRTGLRHASATIQQVLTDM
jgi:hypothetical protein